MPKKSIDKFWWKGDDLIFEEEKSSMPIDKPKSKPKNGSGDFDRIKEKLGVMPESAK